MGDDDRGTLYVVGTPIGNLGDLTKRASEILARADVVAAEDTRRTRGLLSHLGVGGKTIVSFHAHSSARDAARLVEKLGEGKTIALVSDAGMPAVSDPGAELVRAAHDAGHKVVPIPGASAVLAALVGSGLSTGAGFRFLGFWPREGKERRAALAKVGETEEPCVLFEAPGRARDTLKELAEFYPLREACLCRELTKVHESFERGTLTALAAAEEEVRGEIVIVLGTYARDAESAPDDDAIDARIDEELGRGLTPKVVAERVAAWSGRKKREVYERVIARK